MKTCITIDLDDYRDYQSLVAGDARDADHSFYPDAMPRFLDLFERHGVRATFFVVGRDLSVVANRKLVREMAERGHEIGNHSYAHPYNFRALSRIEKEVEIAQADAAIADAIGSRPVGFRVPSCDVDLETLSLLAEREYLYDSSVFPSPIMWLFMLYGKLFVKKAGYQLGAPMAALAPRHPYFPSPDCLHRRRADADERAPRILEIPFSVMGCVRFPFYSTLLRRFGGRRLFDRMHRAYGTRPPLLHIVFHMIELAQFDDTPLGRRYQSMPGLAVPLADRERFVGHVVEAVAERDEVVTLSELAESLVRDEAASAA